MDCLHFYGTVHTVLKESTVPLTKGCGTFEKRIEQDLTISLVFPKLQLSKLSKLAKKI